MYAVFALGIYASCLYHSFEASVAGPDAFRFSCTSLAQAAADDTHSGNL